MQRYIAKLANISLARLWELLSRPSMIPVIATRPSSSSIKDALSFLFDDATSEKVKSFRLDFVRNHRFFNELDARFVEKRNRRVQFNERQEFLYLLIRCCEPEWVVETGVFDGMSSSLILQALHDNDRGSLISVDFPATERAIPKSTDTMVESTLPAQCQPGWAIPDYLRERHRLLLGDSKELLPKVFEEHPVIDVFLHDSLHTFEHQYWEYSTAWPHLPAGGLLLSDDIFWNAAFHKFCNDKHRPYTYLSKGGTVKGGFGAARKTAAAD